MQQNGEEIKRFVPIAGGWPETSLSWGLGGTLNEVELLRVLLGRAYSWSLLWGLRSDWVNFYSLSSTNVPSWIFHPGQ